MARVRRPAGTDGLHLLIFTFFMTFFIPFVKLSQQNMCAQGTRPCGQACVASQSECRDNRCWDTSGRQILCYPSFHVCGETVCPRFAWCNGEQCLPNTCAHRHKAWCPEDSGALTATKCIKQAPKTQCYASTGGLFSCYVGSGLMVAKCGSRMAVAMAAMQQHSPQHPWAKHPAHLSIQGRISSTVVQQGHGQPDVSSTARDTPIRSVRRTLLRYGNTLSAIFTGVASITSALGLGQSGLGLYDSMYDTSMLSAPSGMTGNGKYSNDPYSSPTSSVSSSSSPYGNGATAESGSLNMQGYMNDGAMGYDQYSGRYTSEGSGYGYQDSASGYQQPQTSYQPSGYISSSNIYTPNAGLSSNQMGMQYATGAQGSSVASFTPAVGSTQTAIQPGSSAGAFIRAGQGGLVAGSYGGGYAGAYSSVTGTYGPGASYGYPASYQGKASGKAVVFMPAWFDPSKPNITYPCPDGMPTGSMISVGIPCGIPMISVDASQLPTIDGLPAAVDLSKSGLAQTVGPYNGGAGAAGTPNTYVPSSTATTQEAGMAQPVILNAYRANPVYTSYNNMRLGNNGQYYEDFGSSGGGGGGASGGIGNDSQSFTFDSDSDVAQMLSFMAVSAGNGADNSDIIATNPAAHTQSGSHKVGGSAPHGSSGSSNGSNSADDYMASLLTAMAQGGRFLLQAEQADVQQGAVPRHAQG